MELIGVHIEELDSLLRAQTEPTPAFLRDWQIEAEHVVNVAEFAKRNEEFDKLREIDGEARRLLQLRENLMNSN